MEAETIIYFHPVTEQIPASGAAKRHWWQNAVLKSQILPAADSGKPFTLVDCSVPPFYYRRKIWKPADLSEAMEAVLRLAPGIADVYLHPQIVTMVSEIYADRWETCVETVELLLARILSEYGASCIRRKGQATVLLGTPEETERQMEMTWRLLEPYLHRINSLVFYYRELEEIDIWEELSSHLEMYYYEYGLVPQLVPYQIRTTREVEKKYRGSLKYEGLVLDYDTVESFGRLHEKECGCVGTDAASERKGGAACLSRNCIYVDVASCQEKEQAYTGKDRQILYVSPLKYLDTMVKNSYDRLVH